MEITAIKTMIQKPIKKVLPYAIGALALFSCTSPSGKIKDYCEEYNKSAATYSKCINGCEPADRTMQQAILDSLVYRDLLNGSKLAQDSSAVAEFNKISTTHRYSPLQANSRVESNLKKEEISTKDYNKIMDQVSPVKRQFMIDEVLFAKFFREKGLMSDEFARKFIAVSKFLNPGMNYKAYEIKRIEKDDAYTASRVGVYIPVVEETKGHNAIRY